MINDIKIGLKVIKYSLNLKSNIFSAILLLVVGFFMVMLEPVSPIGGIYLGLGVVVIAQIMHSVAVSKMVQTSPYKRKLQTIVPALLGLGYLFVTNTIHLLLKWLGFYMLDWNPKDVSRGIFLYSFMVMLVVFYAGTAYKMLWRSGIALMVFALLCFIWGDNFAHDIIEMKLFGGEIPLGLSILISYVTIVVSCVIMYLISCLLYKKEYSKMAFEAALNRAK